jgi:hypothetical protein
MRGGHRTGKTTGGSITAILSAASATAATSNKRDLVDAGPLRAHGEVWIVDPQQIVDDHRIGGGTRSATSPTRLRRRSWAVVWLSSASGAARQGLWSSL